MTLTWGPHTRAIGIHILLEETGAPYETEQLDIAGKATREPSCLAINPKGKVPTLLRDDGSVLTEYGAIATWLGQTHPDKTRRDPAGRRRCSGTKRLQWDDPAFPAIRSWAIELRAIRN